MNWLQNFSYIEGNSPSFKGVRALVEADQFSDALKVLDASNYKYSSWPEFQTLRNNLINMINGRNGISL